MKAFFTAELFATAHVRYSTVPFVAATVQFKGCADAAAWTMKSWCWQVSCCPSCLARVCTLLWHTQVIIGLLRNAMIKSGAKNFLVDGFPRELSQAYTFEDMIKPCK